ncbi:MAG: DUF4855 domain-containing protein [Fimbriimonadales bacterium]
MLPVLLAALGTCGAATSFPRPGEAGFHHAALIYGKAQRTSDDLALYVAEHRDGKPSRWMFDAFLFLIRNLPSGAITEVDPTRRSDWEYHLDQWFQEGRDLRALDGAIEEAAAVLGAPPAKRQIILSVPYPHPEVRDFGDVDGDGRSEDLATAEDRRAVLEWYVGEAIRRFTGARFRHLRLWGFYWMREDLHGADGQRLRDMADVVHRHGLRVLWIPYHNAPGWTAWRDVGIDVCIRQPNYAFWEGRHEGSVRANRLSATADEARAAGAGIEIEAGEVVSSPDDRRAFLQYLALGAPDRSGYQQGAMAYYLGTDVVERSARSPDPEVRAVYASLASFVAGERVPEPDPAADLSPALPIAWDRGGSLRLRWYRTLDIEELEVFLKEGNEPWRGSVRVDSRTPKGWEPAGWALRPASDATSGQHQVVVVPIRGSVRELRLRWEGTGCARLVRIGVRPGRLERVREHLWVGEPYVIDPPVGEASYPDSGGLLTDGLVAEAGFRRGVSVGWLGGTVRVVLDLGRRVSCDEVRLRCYGGGHAGIGWPAEASAILSELPVTGLQGTGEAPRGLWMLPVPELRIESRRSETDLSGSLVFRPPHPVAGLHLLVSARASGWLMLDEIEVWSGGQNVARARPYRCLPEPSCQRVPESSYPDDGVRLTDGRIAEVFGPGRIVAWKDAQQRTIRIRPARREVREVAVWVLMGGRHGIFAPESVTVRLRTRSGAWTSVAAKASSVGKEDGSSCRAVCFRALFARRILTEEAEIVVQGQHGSWVAVSEVEAR